MRETRIGELTDAQRACLRLVYTHHSSKEIAALLGVSPSAIDKRLERAVQQLNATSRFEAARLFHEHESSHRDGSERATSEWLPSEPIDVLPVASSGPSTAQDEPWGLIRRFLGLTDGGGSVGEARVRSTRAERFFRLIVTTALMAIASVALVNLLLTVSTILRDHRGPHHPSPARHSSASNGG